MIKKLSSLIAICLILAGLLLTAGCSNDSNVEKFQPDTKINPGDSFYHYINNAWISANPIPDEYSRWGSFDLLGDETFKKLNSIFENSVSNPKNDNEKMIGRFYAAAMDEKAIELAGSSPLKKGIERIEAINTVADVTGEIAYQNSLFFSPFFSINVWPDLSDSTTNLAEIWQGGLGLPEKSYYIDAERADIREKYTVHISRMFELAGFSADESSEKAGKILELETLLAKASRSPEEARDVVKNFNKTEVSSLAKIAPDLDWKSYFNTIGVPAIKTLNVGQPEYLEAVNKLIAGTSMDDLRDYLMWNWLNNTAGYLSTDFMKEDFGFYEKTLRGTQKMKERYKIIADFMNNFMGDAVGQAYVDKYFPPEAKKRADELVKNLLAAMKIHLEGLSWMSEDTKATAMEKLGRIGVKIGYPNKWRDYSKVKIGSNYFENAVCFLRNEFDYAIQKQGKPVDRDEWGIYPQVVNAFYNPSANEIIFPAAILQPPFFDFMADDALNYGAIGVVIGHEITHAFDDQGRKFNPDGNLEDWWTEDDAVRFEALAKKLVDQYDNYQVDSNAHVNGQLTLGENIADLGGVEVSYTAFRMTKPGDNKLIEKMTPDQRFFAGFARIWRMNIRPEEALRLIKIDPHSPCIFRVDGTLSNVPEFMRAFNVRNGNALFKPEGELVKIW